MRCPFCGDDNTRVIDSRPADENQAIRRRRQCDECGKRFTTYEKVEEVILMVIKRYGSRQAFDRMKVINGIIKACEKRPVSMDTIEYMVDQIERGLNNMMKKEVESSFIGELIMKQLREVDQVAYVRFASVYRDFADVETFVAEIEKLLGQERKEK